jgi:uncharacterized membrane protein YciS (DUF1049 family)
LLSPSFFLRHLPCGTYSFYGKFSRFVYNRPKDKEGVAMSEQNLANHTRIVPLFHIFVLRVLILNFGWSIYRWKVAEFSISGLVSVLLAAALILLALLARVFALTVQDRVIRLEERLRYERLLPAGEPQVRKCFLSRRLRRGRRRH